MGLKHNNMAKNKTINVKGTEIAVIQKDHSDYISLTFFGAGVPHVNV
jgi:hypothetical protein